MKFYKFDGAGNDFILVDIRQQQPPLGPQEVAWLCHRRYGIGADGLMTLSEKPGYDFEMRYYNSDGLPGSMCGNGGRCITAFAFIRGIRGKMFPNLYHFLGYDGPHNSQLRAWSKATRRGTVCLGMQPVEEIRPLLHGWFLDTGSPHYVEQVTGLASYDVAGRGRALRCRKELFPQGTNVDFIEPQADGTLFVRTYERGVEDETLSCGTGVTASALVYATQLQGRQAPKHHIAVATRGGAFKVDFKATPTGAKEIALTGEVSLNFEGTVEVERKAHGQDDKGKLIINN